MENLSDAERVAAETRAFFDRALQERVEKDARIADLEARVERALAEIATIAGEVKERSAVSLAWGLTRAATGLHRIGAILRGDPE